MTTFSVPALASMTSRTLLPICLGAALLLALAPTGIDSQGMVPGDPLGFERQRARPGPLPGTSGWEEDSRRSCTAGVA
jgi:hypothetical protein